MGLKGRKTSSKNPPIFSHEFVIQNHADIVSCVAMVFVVGLLVQVTSPIAYMFVAIHHNVTSLDPSESSNEYYEQGITYFTYGVRDTCAVFFYFLICIVMHAIVQEYIIDKITRKLHLSKVKHSMFNESGQLFIFYLVSVFWGADIIFRENYLVNISSLWEGYPHANMTFVFKFFYIIQLSYWLHCFPELYFQKVKREEMGEKIRYASLYLLFITACYITNLTRVGLCLIVLHYSSQVVFHVARLIDFVDKTESRSQAGYFVSKIVFVLVRLASIILSVLTFWYGLALNENQGLDVATGNFNTQYVRFGALVAVGSLQAYLMWLFITSQLAKMREMSSLQQSIKKKSEKKPLQKKRDRSSKKQVDDDVSELPEVDQNTAKKHLKNKQKTK